jgi:hypothetical protein
VESENVKIDDLKLKKSISHDISKIDKKYQQEDDDVEFQQEDDDNEIQENKPYTDEEDNEEMLFPKAPSIRVQKNHLEIQIIGDKNA